MSRPSKFFKVHIQFCIFSVHNFLTYEHFYSKITKRTRSVHLISKPSKNVHNNSVYSTYTIFHRM